MSDQVAASLAEAAAEIERKFHSDCLEASKHLSSKTIETLRLTYLGRKGLVQKLLEDLRSCSAEQRPAAGRAINLLKKFVEDQLAELKVELNEQVIQDQLAGHAIDVTLPVKKSSGSLHPITLMRAELLQVLGRLGFSVHDGPEIEFEQFNFNALNIPDHHPARDMQDTFYIKNYSKQLLRTHTSNVQIHAMLQERPPLRIVAPGRVYRCDSDPTHTPMFHQIEGFVVDKTISFGHLKGTVDALIKGVFGADFKTRFRPSFFPFVEPGAEVDLQCSQCTGRGCSVCKETGWLEIGGCGMIHPNVFEAVNYDSDIYQGFAFGFGIDRMAMLKYRLPDLRQLFDGDLHLLGQFPTASSSL